MSAVPASRRSPVARPASDPARRVATAPASAPAPTPPGAITCERHRGPFRLPAEPRLRTRPHTFDAVG